jgi:LmbE family N-acetylglucosaminyl deacetylase
MQWLDLIQWPAMIVTVCASWFVAANGVTTASKPDRVRFVLGRCARPAAGGAGALMEQPTTAFDSARGGGVPRYRPADDPLATNEAATSEATWRESLQGLAEWMPHTRTLAVVAAQPDDETLGAGGLIHTCAELGYEITIILVTDGGAARPGPPDLGQRRCQQLRSALMRLAPDGAHVTRLCLPDGKIASFEGALVQRLLETIPRDCTLVAPYENDGHADHSATSLASQTAALALGVPCARYPVWAWYRSNPQELSAHRMRRVSLAESARQAKQQAIACYESQMEAR